MGMDKYKGVAVEGQEMTEEVPTTKIVRDQRLNRRQRRALRHAVCNHLTDIEMHRVVQQARFRQGRIQ